nr:MurR/RpiR family transcriptional regulator [uncultured Devosia sp.]
MGPPWYSSFMIDQTDMNSGLAEASALLRHHYETHARTLTRTERQVADYLLTLAPTDLAFRSAEEIAAATGTSDATVIRTARRLGFSGLPELKRLVNRPIATHSSPGTSLSRKIRAVPPDALAARDAIFAAAQEILESTREALDPASVERAVELFEQSGTVWCIGIGVAEQPARHLATGLLRAGVLARAVSASGFDLANNLIGLRPGDTAVIFHAATRRKDIAALLDHARQIGVTTVLVSGTQLNELYRDRVTVALHSVAVASKLASWLLGATVIGDVLTFRFSARNPERAAQTHDQLNLLRREFE